MDPAPGPIALSEQYKKAFDDQASEEEDEADVATASKAKSKNKKVKKPVKPRKSKGTRPKAKPKRFSFRPSPNKATAAIASSCGDTAKHVQQEDQAYCPHHFSEKSKIFVQTRISEGFSYRDAQKLWRESHERAQLLATVPLKELKRRKFVAKGVQENPFKAALAGA